MLGVWDYWIDGEKYLYSQAAGMNVGVPTTVDRLIARAHSLKQTHDKKSKLPFLDFELFLSHIPPREVIIKDYFFNNGVDRNNRRNLSIELSDFGSQKYNIPFSKVVINRELIADYAKANSLSGRFEREIANHFSISLPAYSYVDVAVSHFG